MLVSPPNQFIMMMTPKNTVLDKLTARFPRRTMLPPRLSITAEMKVDFPIFALPAPVNILASSRRAIHTSPRTCYKDLRTHKCQLHRLYRFTHKPTSVYGRLGRVSMDTAVESMQHCQRCEGVQFPSSYDI